MGHDLLAAESGEDALRISGSNGFLKKTGFFPNWPNSLLTRKKKPGFSGHVH